MEPIRTKRLHEKIDSINNFTAQFYNDQVLLGGVNLPLGQVSAEVLNLDIEKLQDLRETNDKLFRAFKEILKPRKRLRSEQVVRAQELFDESVNVILDLPLYRQLKIDTDELRSLFTMPYKNNPFKFKRAMKTPGQMRDAMLDIVRTVCKIPDEMITFSVYTQFMLTDYFERLKYRQPEKYAVSVYKFFSNYAVQRDIVKVLAPLSWEPYRLSRPVSFEYVTMPDPNDKTKYIIAERLVFHTAAAFCILIFIAV